MINFGIFIHTCKINTEGPKPLEALEDRNLKDPNAQTKPKIHAKTPMDGSYK